MRRVVFCGVGILGVFGGGFLACVGDQNDVVLQDAGTNDGASGNNADGSTQNTNDGGNQTQDAGCSTAPACVADGGAVNSCGTTAACQYGCTPAAGTAAAHCLQIDPSGAIDPSDLAVVGVKDFVAAGAQFDTDTGKITSTDGATVIRSANTNPDAEEVDATTGIGFRRVAGSVGIFQFKSLTVNAGSGLPPSSNAIGSIGLALVAQTTITINSEIDVGTHYFAGNNPPASGPGGVTAVVDTEANGYAPNDGGISGGSGLLGTGSIITSGGGGGGHAANGGAGGGGTGASGGSFGPTYDDTSFDPLIGGGGGGAGRTFNGQQAAGGRGGGAIALVAGQSITIGNGSGSASNGAYGLAQGINAGGEMGSYSTAYSGGGGGAGGTILLEAPIVTGNKNAGVAANGGAGGNAATSVPPANDGVISNTAAYAAGTSGCEGAAGVGSADGTFEKPLSGGSGADPGSSCASGTRYGGGGGGGAGRILVLTSTGDFTSVDPAFVVSPSATPAFVKGPLPLR